jgi:hypothetical protein
LSQTSEKPSLSNNNLILPQKLSFGIKLSLNAFFKPSGTFSYATSHLSEKASKAMFCIRKSLFSDRINLVSHLKLFEACVKPILLYCSDIWGLPLLVNEKSFKKVSSMFIVCNQKPSAALIALIARGNNPSSDMTVRLVADLSTPKIYLAYFI